MSHPDRPSWYHPDDVAATVRDADRTSEVSTQDIVDVLARAELDAPKDRIRSTIETTRTRLSDIDDSPTHDFEDPRPLHPRFVDAADVAYLGTREFATVLGVVLSRYEGSFRIPDDIDAVAVDLFWNRQHVTIAFRALPRPPEKPVDEDDVAAVVDGDTKPAVGRSPSVVGIVSNAGFTTFAQEYAEEHGVQLFGGNYLRRWFEDARLTYDVLGVILEEGERSPEELTELVDTLPPLPDAVREIDPLGELPDEVWNGTGDGSALLTPGEKRIPVADPRPGRGEKGALYAEPGDDGDYGAFDRFADELREDNE